jgi:hypothetical protein
MLGLVRRCDHSIHDSDVIVHVRPVAMREPFDSQPEAPARAESLHCSPQQALDPRRNVVQSGRQHLGLPLRFGTGAKCLTHVPAPVERASTSSKCLAHLRDLLQLTCAAHLERSDTVQEPVSADAALLNSPGEIGGEFRATTVPDLEQIPVLDDVASNTWAFSEPSMEPSLILNRTLTLSEIAESEATLEPHDSAGNPLEVTQQPWTAGMAVQTGECCPFATESHSAAGSIGCGSLSFGHVSSQTALGLARVAAGVVEGFETNMAPKTSGFVDVTCSDPEAPWQSHTAQLVIQKQVDAADAFFAMHASRTGSSLSELEPLEEFGTLPGCAFAEVA